MKKTYGGLNEKYKLFEDGIQPCDVIQGGIGDCYFLTCLSCMAEEPNRIKKMFHDKFRNK